MFHILAKYASLDVAFGAAIAERFHFLLRESHFLLLLIFLLLLLLLRLSHTALPQLLILTSKFARASIIALDASIIGNELLVRCTRSLMDSGCRCRRILLRIPIALLTRCRVLLLHHALLLLIRMLFLWARGRRRRSTAFMSRVRGSLL